MTDMKKETAFEAAGTHVFFQALSVDNSLPIEPEAVRLWLTDLRNPLRWTVMPVLRLLYGLLLHLIWAFKRISPFQFQAHGLLQNTICWFCNWFVSPEANQLILRHYFTESSILNFLIDNSGAALPPIQLYPETIDAMKEASFVDHDQELFRCMRDLGPFDDTGLPLTAQELRWDHFRPVPQGLGVTDKRWSQVLDFETSHVLFMCIFCLLLKREDYRAAINGFNLDQSIAIRISKMLGDPSIVEMAYNKYPLYLVGPWNLTQRFLMHGFFTEYLYARLAKLQKRPTHA